MQARELGKTLIVIGVIIVLVVGLLGGAYALGFGFPTQQQTVAGLLAAHTAGDPVETLLGGGDGQGHRQGDGQDPAADLVQHSTA